MEFPRLVFKSASINMLADDKEQYDALISGGWFATVPAAIAGVVKAPSKSTPAEDEATNADDPAPTREELEQKATELGIKFDGRTTDAKLAAYIAKALG